MQDYSLSCLTFAVWIYSYAVITYNCAAIHYDMQVGSLILEFALVPPCSSDYARTVALWSLIRSLS